MHEGVQMVDAKDDAIMKVGKLELASVVESEPKQQTKAVSRAQKVKWRQGDKGIWKPNQGEKHNGGN